jgi:hypothetical protein
MLNGKFKTLSILLLIASLGSHAQPSTDYFDLLGADSNSNGIRDDIDKYLVNRHGDNKIHHHIMQMVALYYSSIFAMKADKTITITDVSDLMAISMQCISDHMPSEEEAMTEVVIIRTLMVNNEARAQALDEYHALLHGSIRGDVEFDPRECTG